MEKKLFLTNITKKKAGVTMLISGKIEFKAKLVRRDEKGYFIIRTTIHQEDIIVLNIYTHNFRKRA